jgi:hypothetical protein
MYFQVVRVAFAMAMLAVFAACDSSPDATATVTAKKIVTLGPIQNVTIAVPALLNGPGFYDFGPNLQSSLANAMDQSGRYNLYQPQMAEGAVGASAKKGAEAAVSPDPSPTPSPSDSNDVQWDGSSLVPSATVNFRVDALQMETGDRGDQMFYGFNERFRTIFNDGSNTYAEEFPLSLVTFQPNWFDRSYDDKATAPLDSQSGLDLGQGFTLDALVAWVDIKYATYRSEIRVQAELDAPLANRHETKEIQVTGSGFYYDIVGGYLQWSGGIGLARRDAMTAAFNNAFAGTFSVIDNWIKDLPLTAKVFAVAPDGRIFLNTGGNSNVPAGTKFQSVTNHSLVVEVTQTVPSGSIAKLDSGNLADLQTSLVMVQVQTTAQPPVQGNFATGNPTAMAAETVTLPETDLPKSDFAGNGYDVTEDWTQALWLSVSQGWALPYRIWRYFQYDQDYAAPAAIRGSRSTGSRPEDRLTPVQTDVSTDYAKQDGAQPVLAQSASDWANEFKLQPWAAQIGLNAASAVSAKGPIVAIIDSGIDYNHPALKNNIWVNPKPFTDPDGNTDLYGWDFISGDPRPYDDAYRGTEVASVVLGVAPTVQLMPLKIFNPFGVTSSAAMYGAFQYAVDHGAQIIVCSWATRVKTKTLDLAVQYAQKHGVLVVAAAGDLGDDLSKIPAYPASLSKTYDNVLTVTGVDTNNLLVKVNSYNANFDSGTVGLAAPGQDILAAQPRNHTSQETSTGLAAALVAGAVARNIAASGATSGAAAGTTPGTYLDWIKAVKAQSQAVSALSTAVQGGLVLRIK